VPAKLILDTGAFVALVDRSEKRHADCVRVLSSWAGLILTTEAVLTETLHLLGPSWPAQKICLEFVNRGAFLVVPSSADSLKRVTDLMEKYHDVPMDFADATLVALAEEAETEQIFTLDRRDFLVYRRRRDQPFTIVP
jgi:predicted nucleic acid-binding protein